MPRVMADAEAEARARASAELQRRQRKQRLALEAVYDWYGHSCPCNLPPGKCRIHPRARPKQRPPAGPWRTWLMMAGRNGGKTFPASKFVNWKVEHGHWKEIVFVNATIGDTRDIMVQGPSGVVETSPPWCKAHFLPAKSQVEWRTASGEFIARAYLRTSEVPDGLRGPNADGVWGDEPGKWEKQQETWNQIGFTLRRPITPPPQCVLSGTPIPSPVMTELRDDAKKEEDNPGSTGVFITSWHTMENHDHMDPGWLATQMEKWKGTLFGRQELGGELIVVRPGALWTPADFDYPGFRIADRSEIEADLEYIGVAVDPGMGGQDEKHASETGIIVGGRLRKRFGQLVSQGVILADRSTKGNPGDWARAVVRAYVDYGANEVIAEKNQGGEMVRHVIETVPAQGGYPSGRNIPIKLVYASVGKIARAEPIQALYQAQRIRHALGCLDAVEDQMIQFLSGKSGQKLDRVDALVWLLAECIIGHDDFSETGPILIGGERVPFVHQGFGGHPWSDYR